MARDAETRAIRDRGKVIQNRTDLSEGEALTVAWKERGYSASGIAPDDLWDLSPGVQQQWVDVSKDNIEHVPEDVVKALEETGRWER